jgi:hypothetical protein
LQLLEQVVTSSQHRSHFFRQLKGRPQVTHILVGKFSFLIPRGILDVLLDVLVLPRAWYKAVLLGFAVLVEIKDTGMDRNRYVGAEI